MDIYAVLNWIFCVLALGVIVTYFGQRKFRGKDFSLIRKGILRKRKKYTRYQNVEHARPLSDEEYNRQRKEKQHKTDKILDKISQRGYESLSKSEKEFLFKQGRDR